MYHACAIQEPACQPERYHRGKQATAYQVPGLWFDLDLAYGRHAASALPATDGEALYFLHTLPVQPSLIVHRGGDMYGWWLFKEPFTITNDAERRDIAHFSKRFTHTLCEAGKEHGWTLDASTTNTANPSHCSMKVPSALTLVILITGYCHSLSPAARGKRDKQ